jgi:hypothetical protein
VIVARPTPREANAAIRERNRAFECFPLNQWWRPNRHGTTTREELSMKRNMKTILMGTVALMAGVGLASAQGMRDVPGSANDRGASSSPASSDHMTPGKSGKGAERGKSEKSETRGQAQRGPSDKDMSKGQAKSERPEKSTSGQGGAGKDELKS